MDYAQRDAETLDLAGGTVRHLALAARQDRGPRGRDEDTSPAASAISLSLSGDLANSAWLSPASNDVNAGALMPPNEPFPVHRKPRLMTACFKRRWRMHCNSKTRKQYQFVRIEIEWCA
jgi:hypothetical protein